LSRLPARRLGAALFSALSLGLLAVAPAAPPVQIKATPVASPGWLIRFNQWRGNTGTSPLTENTTWSAGDYSHALYMVKNDLVTHYETPGVPYYTVDGDTAARNSNIFVSSSTATTDDQAIDWWMGAPFHALGMMDPRLTTTGFGSYREVKSGWDMGAAVDVLRGNSFTGGSYPVYFPGNGTSEPLTSYSGNEFPDPLQACPGYSMPTGLPVFVQTGGNIATSAGAHSFTGNGVALDHCVIDSNSPSVGSSLTYRGAVVVIPRQPLQSGVRYTVAVTVNGTPYAWSFTVGPFFTITGVSPTYGPPAGGTTVTITGTGFSNHLTAVKFGATAAASFAVVNDSTVTAVSPAHAVGPVDITVTTASGTSAITSADQFTFATPCTSVTLSAAPPTQSVSGTQVTLTGSGVCPDPNPLYEFWVRPAASPTWTLLGGYTTSNQFVWDSTGALGVNYFGVWVHDVNSTGINTSAMGANDAFAGLTYNSTSPQCTAATISSSPGTAAVVGTTVTLAASSSGCPAPRYEFWMRPAASSTWQLAQSYGTSSSFVWNTAGAAPGGVYFGAWAKNATSSTTTFDANAATLYTLTSACGAPTLAAAPLSQTVSGTQVTLTAGATACADPRFEFWMRPASSTTWTMVQAYGTTNTFTWNSSGASGIVYFGLWVKDVTSATSTFDTNAALTYTVTAATCKSVTATPAPSSVVHGTASHSTITATASGCTNASPLYAFWMRPASSNTWTLVQGYTANSTFDWNSSGAAVGTVYFGVWVKDAGSPTTTFDANVAATVTVT
jgi:hypothetical protein